MSVRLKQSSHLGPPLRRPVNDDAHERHAEPYGQHRHRNSDWPSVKSEGKPGPLNDERKHDERHERVKQQAN